MHPPEIMEHLGRNPVIAAICDDGWDTAFLRLPVG